MPYIFGKYYPPRNIIFFLGEGLIIFLSLLGVSYFFEEVSPGAFGPASLTHHMVRALIVTLIFQVCFYYFELYDLRSIPSVTELTTRSMQAFGFGCIILGIIYMLVPYMSIPSKVFFLAYAFVCLCIALWRWGYLLVLDKKLFTRPAIIVGTGRLANDIYSELSSRKDAPYRIEAFIGPKDGADIHSEVPIYEEASQLYPVAQEKKAEKIIVALDDRRGKTPVKELLECRIKGIPVVQGITFYEELTGKILVERTNPAWLIFSEGFKKSKITLFVKRTMDISLSVVGLVMALPIIAISAIIIKIESKGPVFYKQERVGLDEKTFKVIKFRSMIQDAEKDGKARWATEDDPRVTHYGRIMRKYRIDEIPQMWNVLKGEMSFVGPRPERPQFVKVLKEKIPYYALRHSVKPGLTGWAQIFYPYGASEEDALKKLEYDLYYIKNLGLWMDLKILFDTGKIVLFKKGAR